VLLGCLVENWDVVMFFFFSSRRRHTRCLSDWSSDVCSSDLACPNLRLMESPIRLCACIGTINRGGAERHSPAFWFIEGWVQFLRSEERRVGKECSSRG